jgi:hypothetical protein
MRRRDLGLAQTIGRLIRANQTEIRAIQAAIEREREDHAIEGTRQIAIQGRR